MNTTTKNKWVLRTTNHIGKMPRPKNPRMWISATCTTAPISADRGEGLNFLVTWARKDKWTIENWIEPLDELPELPDSVYEDLLRSFDGEIEIEI